MKNLNQRLIFTLIWGWLAFLVSGLTIQFMVTSPSVIILIDRSYCPPNQWQNLVNNYQELYEKNQLKSLQIEKVIVFSDLGEEVLTTPPEPQKIKELSRYGRSNPQRWEQMKTLYPQATVLVCR